jgi:hypothetical protein
LTELQLSSGPAAGEFVRVGTAATSFPADAQEAKEQFRQFRAIHLANLLDPALLATMLRMCESSTWEPVSGSWGYREREEPQRAGRVLNLSLNRPSMLRWLEEATGCGPLAKVEGTLAQTLNRPGDELTWHDDYPERGRKLAFVVNLSTEPYVGGEFELRRKSGEMIFSHRYDELNSALIFAVDPGLEHRVLRLTAGGPRRVFAGWAFRTGAL